jgi:predicted small lipoprotein YifL
MTQNNHAPVGRKGKVRLSLLILGVLVLAVPLSACGKKGWPNHPEDSKYPSVYPSLEKEKVKDKKGKTQPKQGTVGPGGMIYEYPNRPPAK